MRLKFISKFLLMITIFTSLFSLVEVCTPVYGATAPDEFTMDYQPAEPYLYDDHLFCIDHAKGYTVYPGQYTNIEDQINVWKKVEEREFEQSIAFAIYTANELGTWDPEVIQQVIWSSGQFSEFKGYVQFLEQYTGDTTSPLSSEPVIARSNQYAQFFYGILNGKNEIQFTTETENSKVLVNQKEQTYIVGPYKVDIADTNLTGAVADAKEILYNELSGENAKNYPGCPIFAEYEITGLDGDSVEFLDKNGEVITFPNWNEDFYIRFKPNEGVTKINPGIKIHFISKVTGSAAIYVGDERTTIKGSCEGFPEIELPEYYTKDDIVELVKEYIQGYMKFDGNPNSPVSFKDIELVDYEVTIKEDEDGKLKTYITSFKFEAKLENADDLLQELTFLAESQYSGFVGVEVNPEWNDSTVELGEKDISMELGGNVWQDFPSDKLYEYTGVRTEGEDAPFAGMEVRLYSEDGTLVDVVTTDGEGKYHFKGLDPLKKYYVIFVYNGQLYEATYYKNDLSGGYSNAQEIDREALNAMFESIDSSPQNYKGKDGWHKSYGLLTKLARDNGEYIENGSDNNGGIDALRFQDAWEKFLELAVDSRSYSAEDSNLGDSSSTDDDTTQNKTGSAYDKLDEWMQSKSVGQVERQNVLQFIKDCMIEATTNVNDPLGKQSSAVLYPVYDMFALEDIDNPPETVESVTFGSDTYYYLYTKPSDQSRYVDFGIKLRDSADVRIQKDVYKATVIVNGKKHDYIYNKKDADEDGGWTVEVRAGDELFNGLYDGRHAYTRELRQSEYLYKDENDEYKLKDIQIFVQYRITVKNNSQTYRTSINEIVDYYDADQYTFDGESSGGAYTFNSYNEYNDKGEVTNTYVNSYIGANAKGKAMDGAQLIVRDNTQFPDRESHGLSGEGYNYKPLYLSGIKSHSGNDRFEPGEMGTVYLTFKVNKDSTTGKVKIDQDLMTGEIKIGKRNIAEINGYSTYYGPNASVPNYLNEDNSRVDTSVSNKPSGIVATESNAGSLTSSDLTADGDLRRSKTSQVENRLEPDTDKAPNLKVVITQDNGDIRRISGYVFEDVRTDTTEDGAVVGNGVYKDGEVDAENNPDQKINGVKVELVELVPVVDNNGMFKGSYTGERVWASTTYWFENGQELSSEDTSRYASGSSQSRVLISGREDYKALYVPPDTFEEPTGMYSFKSLPPGDLFIRFTYGDHTDTVLLNDDNDVNNLIGKKGLNSKSYNGQDYKSTIYQKDMNQNTNYNGIDGFIRYDSQNYNNGTDKTAMYYYDINEGNAEQNANKSDAKDVYSYRESVNKWSAGADGNNLLNNRAEILNSFEKLGTYTFEDQYPNDEVTRNQARATEQNNMINDLITHTQMVAQTGIIDTEIEFNRKQTDGQDSENDLPYHMGGIDLGLQERSKAQIKLNKEVTHILITLNGADRPLFDTSQSGNDLHFGDHKGHTLNYSGFKLTGFALGQNSKQTPELIQAVMDEELIAGSTVTATYNISVENVGEIDYKDKQFYYTGHTNDSSESNVSKTKVNEIVDYVSNLLKYDPDVQDPGAGWTVSESSDFTLSANPNSGAGLDNDLVNRQYLSKISTYNTLLTTNNLNDELLPTLKNPKESSDSVQLVLSSLLTSTNEGNYSYNNLAETISTSNELGRRMAYSVSGNQRMSDQSLGDNTDPSIETQLDVVQPDEIDADSAQKIVILPPFGEDKNILQIVLIGIAVAVIIVGGVIIIRRKVS